ncbi:DUF4114 domain-containing protein [Okeania sp. KiyG1]|uniref:DUF4114 domain-containing protein n=1 Tax=Okeania sp. KiyG1 TaxID=2720165 RepID=UPI0019230AD0|nr:DUF4114 domain-containing protein [Okeania sp. KiyG1]GFZ90858.1 hypothetical protein CYANOKiyG1_01170 [Okeania sp. KiyG1]
MKLFFNLPIASTIASLLSVASFASTTQAAILYQASPSYPQLGTRLYASGSDVTVSVLPSEAGFDSYLWLTSPHRIPIASNRETGKIVNLGAVSPGAELLFGLQVFDTGHWYYTGEASRNPDGIAHAKVTYLSPGVARVGFEDIFGGGDWDFDDHTFIFSGINLAPKLTQVQSKVVVKSGEKFDFSASAFDFENPYDLIFSWDFNGDGEIDYEGAEGKGAWSYGGQGVYTSSVTVTDQSGATAQYTFQTEVVPEPTSVISLALLGTFGLGAIARRKDN